MITMVMVALADLVDLDMVVLDMVVLVLADLDIHITEVFTIRTDLDLDSTDSVLALIDLVLVDLDLGLTTSVLAILTMDTVDLDLVDLIDSIGLAEEDSGITSALIQVEEALMVLLAIL